MYSDATARSWGFKGFGGGFRGATTFGQQSERPCRGVRCPLETFGRSEFLSRWSEKRRLPRSPHCRSRLSAYLSLFLDRRRSGHRLLPAGQHSAQSRGLGVTGGVCPVTGRGPVTFPAYLRRLPTSFGVDRRDRRFLGRETGFPAFAFVPPLPTVVPPPLPVLSPRVGSWPSAAEKRAFRAFSSHSWWETRGSPRPGPSRTL